MMQPNKPTHTGGGSSWSNVNNNLRQKYAGQLNKYTNVMKGWQFRWFILNPEKGTLEYHVSENEARTQGNKPRGALNLAGAVISPSEEDSHTFLVNPALGDSFKLRALDAKERQEWITRLRVAAELHSESLGHTNNHVMAKEPVIYDQGIFPSDLTVIDAFSHVQEWLGRADQCSVEIGGLMDKFPTIGPGPKSTDQDLLTLKATSQAAVSCLDECLYSLQLQQRLLVKKDPSSSAVPDHGGGGGGGHFFPSSSVQRSRASSGSHPNNNSRPRIPRFPTPPPPYQNLSPTTKGSNERINSVPLPPRPRDSSVSSDNSSESPKSHRKARNSLVQP